MLKLFCIVFFMQLCSTPNVFAEKSYVFTKDNNSASFVAIGTPGFLRITGNGAFAEGEIKKNGKNYSGELILDLRNFKTDSNFAPSSSNDLRDRHMNEKYLETDKFPHAKLKLTKVILDQGQFSGELTLKEKTGNVYGAMSLQKGILKAAFKIKLKDYPVGVPSYKGITVTDEVEITVNGNFK